MALITRKLGQSRLHEASVDVLGIFGSFVVRVFKTSVCHFIGQQGSRKSVFYYSHKALEL